MVACVVPRNIRIILPSRSLPVQSLRERMQKECHHVGVGVGVRQGEPDSSIRVDGRDQRQPGRDRVKLSVTQAISHGPGFTSETSLVDPGLIYVDHSPFLTQQFYHHECVLLPQHECSVRVGLWIQLFCLHEAKFQVMSHDFPN